MYSPVYLQEYSLFQLIQHVGNNMLHAQIHARSKQMTAHKSVPVAKRATQSKQHNKQKSKTSRYKHTIQSMSLQRGIKVKGV